jgi:hypothetical protein
MYHIITADVTADREVESDASKHMMFASSAITWTSLQHQTHKLWKII